MADLANDAAPSVWHAFDFLDENQSGQVPKSKLKVLTANLGTVLNCVGVENGLQDYRSTSCLGFEDYAYYLRKELYSESSSCNLEPKDYHKRLALVEEVCWLVCRSKILKRNDPVLPDVCVFQLFRIFCMLAEAEQKSNAVTNSTEIAMVLPPEEVEYVVRHFVLALGKEWDSKDFREIAEVVGSFKFAVFLALVENSYSKSIEVSGLMEATQEVFEMCVEDVLKKGILSRKGAFLPAYKACWFVLRPRSLTYFADRSEREKKGEIPIHGKCSVESVAETTNSRGNKFSLNCGEKIFEFITSDHKTKLQWMRAFQTAIEHHGYKESYQKRLATKRRGERNSQKVQQKNEENNMLYQQLALEKQSAELEAERLAREAAETEAKIQANLREQEVQRLKEVETAKKELERLLEEEKQAKRDEEIVRNLQARLLREEWEKREELERLQEDQEKLLKEETNKRLELEDKLLRNEGHLEDVRKQLNDLETERGRREFQLKDMLTRLSQAEQSKNALENNLKETREKMVVAERAREVLESKLRVREKSLIPVRRFPSSNGDDNSPCKMNEKNSSKRGSRKSLSGDAEKECS